MLATITLATQRFTYEDLLKAYFDIKIPHTLLEDIFRLFKRENYNITPQTHLGLSIDNKKLSHIEELIKLRIVLKRIKKPEIALKNIFDSAFFKAMIEQQVYKGDSRIEDDERKLENKTNILISASKKHKTIERFLKSVSKPSQKKEDEQEIDTKVKLMSVHASKGLEFNIVFLVDLTQKMFPNKRLMAGGGSLDEERRLFYVAVTRAKNILWLCYPKKRDNGAKNEPSVFLREGGFVK